MLPATSALKVKEDTWQEYADERGAVLAVSRNQFLNQCNGLRVFRRMNWSCRTKLISCGEVILQVEVDDCLVAMEVDTGASVSIISESTFFRLWPKRNLDTSHVKLQSYTGDAIPVLGCVQTLVSYEGQTAELSLVVVQGRGAVIG